MEQSKVKYNYDPQIYDDEKKVQWMNKIRGSILFDDYFWGNK